MSQGETPIPCVACNQHMKFVDLFEAARDLGAECSRPAITSSATTTARAAGRSTAPPTPTATRAISCSPRRASSCGGCAFRSAGCRRREVRALAREFGLTVADKADSQDICFVPTGHYSEMVERLLPGAAEPGDIVHLDGRVLGRHAASCITPSASAAASASPPASRSMSSRSTRERARVVVGPRAGARDAARQLARFQLDRPGRARRHSRGRPRDRGAGALDPPARRRPAIRRGGVAFDEPESGVSPGQACVFYEAGDPQRAHARRRLYRRSGAVGESVRRRGQAKRHGHRLACLT